MSDADPLVVSSDAGDGMFTPPDETTTGGRFAALADVGRLVAALLADPRVSVQAKLAVGAGVAYVVLPGVVLRRWRPRRVGLIDAALVTVAVRQLILGAGYELIREHWTGTDAGFAWLLAISGVEG